MLVGGRKEGFYEGERCAKRSKCTIAKCTVSLTYSILLRSLINPLAPMPVRIKEWLLETKYSPKAIYAYTKAQDHAECDFTR